MPFADVAVEVHRTRGSPGRRRPGRQPRRRPSHASRARSRPSLALPGMRVRAVSPLVETDPVGGPEQPAYLNAVLVGDSRLSPDDLLRRLHEIEADHGRTREVRWGARTLDLDLIQVGTPGSGSEVRRESPALTLPHPRAHERAFVLRAVVAGRPGRDAPDRRSGCGGSPSWSPRSTRAACGPVRTGARRGDPAPRHPRARPRRRVRHRRRSLVGRPQAVSGGGRELPSTSWLAVFIFVALGLGLLVAGRPVKRLVAGRATRPLNPLYAARVLAMAQAAALTGAGIAGWYAAQILLLVPDADIPSQQLQILVLGILTLVAAGLAAIGLVVQRWCRLDEPDPRPGRPGSAAPTDVRTRRAGARRTVLAALPVQHPEPAPPARRSHRRCAAPSRCR